MSDAAHAYELPANHTVPADAVREAAGGEVVYLTRNGTPVAAVVSAAAAECLEALEDAADIIAARRALGEPGGVDPGRAALGGARHRRPRVTGRRYELQFRPAAVRQLRKLPKPAYRGL